jgi:hypothetical protein
MARSATRKMRDKLSKSGTGKGSKTRPKRVQQFNPNEISRKRRFIGARTVRSVDFS